AQRPCRQPPHRATPGVGRRRRPYGRDRAVHRPGPRRLVVGGPCDRRRSVERPARRAARRLDGARRYGATGHGALVPAQSAESASVNTEMSTDPDQIRAQIAELLADVPDPAQEGSNFDELAESDIDTIAARLEEAHDLLVRALESVEKGLPLVTRRARVDAELVRRGLARSRQQAAELIGAGRVSIDGLPAAKPATAIAVTASLTVEGDDERTWVSRGAHKLIGALDAFGLPVDNRRCLDAGASTGGFTEVLLDRGAGEVVAVDVGYGQLAWSLRTDP